MCGIQDLCFIFHLSMIKHSQMLMPGGLARYNVRQSRHLEITLVTCPPSGHYISDFSVCPVASCCSDGKAAVFMCLVQGNYSDNGSLRSQDAVSGNYSLDGSRNVLVMLHLGGQIFITRHFLMSSGFRSK